MKKLLVLGALALSSTLVLGACGKTDSTTKAKDSTPKQTQQQDNPDQLTYKVNGKDKTVDASTESLTQGFDIKTTKDFEVVKNSTGDFFKGTGDLEGAVVSIDTEESKNPKIDSQAQAMSEAFTNGGKDKKDIDLSKYPGVKAKYDVFTTSVTPQIHKYIFTKTKDNKTLIVVFGIPNSKVTNDTESMVASMAASVKTDK